MEALKHTEWVFGVIFFWFAFSKISLELNPIWIIVIITGSQISDFLELFLVKINISRTSARKLTHDYAIVIIIWMIFPFYSFPEIHLFTTALAVHYLIDLFSGLEPIYIFGFLFGERTAILYVTKAHRITIGKRIEEWGSDYFVAQTEEPTAELAWFWIMQISGSVFCGLGILTYLFLS
ncbi:MAG: hypothetical protein ACTSQ9_06870 [Candidatus Hodarchaeales archaeon]